MKILLELIAKIRIKIIIIIIIMSHYMICSKPKLNLHENNKLHMY